MYLQILVGTIKEFWGLGANLLIELGNLRQIYLGENYFRAHFL